MGIGKRTFPYNGQPMVIREIAKADGCSSDNVRSWYRRHGTLDGFRNRKRRGEIKKIRYCGKYMTYSQIAARLGCSPDTIRRKAKRGQDFIVNGKNKRGMPIPYLEPFYNTLDDSKPFDRCLMAAGYRSVRQFCMETGANVGVITRWRNGKERDGMPLLSEMVKLDGSPSLPLRQLMDGTGFLEYELFPNIFTAEYLNGRIWGNVCGMNTGGTGSKGLVITAERRDALRTLRGMLRTLAERNRQIVMLYFGMADGKEYTLADIGRMFGITRERVRMIIAKCLRFLRSGARLEKLKEVAEIIIS